MRPYATWPSLHRLPHMTDIALAQSTRKHTDWDAKPNTDKHTKPNTYTRPNQTHINIPHIDTSDQTREGGSKWEISAILNRYM